MPLKKSAGNMYTWVTHTKSYLAGECPHRCTYCYVQAMNRRFKVRRYTGRLRLVHEELVEDLGSKRTIFIEHTNDLFAEEVSAKWIELILIHCAKFQNTYVFQSKNPSRFQPFLPRMFPDTILGTTIETNRHCPDIMGDSPHPKARYGAMLQLPRVFQCFVTIEPILDFDVDVLAGWILRLRPNFVNIGADSKGHGLPEPSGDKVQALMQKINQAGIEIRAKSNLQRLLKS